MSKIPITLPYSNGINLVIDDETSQLFYTVVNTNTYTPITQGNNISNTENFYWNNNESAIIKNIEGGQTYQVLAPISGLQLKTIDRSPDESNIYCHFSGGTQLQVPENCFHGTGTITDSGFYRIDIKNRTIDITSLTYTGSTGINILSGETTDSMWWMSGKLINSQSVATVYNGGVALNTWVTAGGGPGTLIMSGGYASKIVVSKDATLYFYDGATAFDITISSGGKLNVFTMDSETHWDEIQNGVFQFTDDINIVR